MSAFTKNLSKVRGQQLRVFDYGSGTLRAQWNEAQADPVELMVYDAIGKDPWTGGGLSASDFRNMLNEACPNKDRDLHLRVNSKGGDVHEGMAIRNMLEEWPKNIVTTVDGVAASTSSWITPAKATVRAFKNSQVFIHDAIGVCGGSAEDMRNFADKLDKTSDQIAGMYAEKTGRRQNTMRQMMRDETLMTGEEALEAGLVDELITGNAVRNFSSDELGSMKNHIRAIYNSAGSGGQPKQQHTCMNRDQMLALLKEHGVSVANDATDEQLQAALKKLLTDKTQNSAAPDATKELQDLKNQISQLTEANNAARTLRITNSIEQLVKDDKLTEAEKPAALARALKDDTYLNELQARPVRQPGAAPLSASTLECTGTSFNDVSNHLLNLGPRFMSNFLGPQNAEKEIGEHGRREIASRALQIANTYRKHRQMFQEMYNTNTLDSDLQRIVLLQEGVEEFAIPLLPLRSFSLVFSNIPLEGTNKVGVPFYPLQTAAANSWVAATGYAAGSFSNSTTNIREVEIGGDGTNSGSSAAANTAKDRKWIGLAFSSYELRRQPFFNAQKLMQQNVNKLAVDIFKDIVSRVITAANYGASIKAVPAAAFSSADVADLYGSATGANWPEGNRALVLDHTFKVSLLKDNAFKQYLAAGTTDALRKAQIKEAYGFEDIPIVPNLTSYSPANENLVGWINWMYAMLVGFAPIMPAPEVRQLLSRYDVVTEPKTGATFEYRQMANTTLDQAQYVAEASYGANIGVASALKRLTSQ